MDTEKYISELTDEILDDFNLHDVRGSVCKIVERAMVFASLKMMEENTKITVNGGLVEFECWKSKKSKGIAQLVIDYIRSDQFRGASDILALKKELDILFHRFYANEIFKYFDTSDVKS